MNTYTLKITGTKYSPYSKLSAMNIVDGGYLLDPMASPLSFFHPLTTNCGSITGSNSVFNLTSFGGEFKIYYNDLKNFSYTTKGDIIFCKSMVTFDFSNFDQSRSRIKSLIFYPDNSNKIQTYAIKISGQSLIYPDLSSSNSVYYPKEKFYTIYKPKFVVNYNDGSTQTVICPLSVLQCGIIDSYKDRLMLESIPYFKDLNNVAIFINDKKDNSLQVSLLDVKSPFVFDTSELDNVALPFSVSPIPLNTVSPFVPILQNTITPSIPEVPANENPSSPPIAIFRYIESSGIILNPNPSEIPLNELFLDENGSIIFGISGAPFDEGDGISITGS